MKPLESETFPLSGNRLIEASAGTGKTYTITNLYLRLLLGQGEHQSRPLAVNQILVLTFTIAATEELRTRIRKRIVEAKRAFDDGNSSDDFLQHLLEQSADASRDRRLLSAALQLLDEAGIFTIHGFCARVLSDNAFETGTLFDQRLDADRDKLLETAVEDCFRADLLTLPAFERSIALRLWPSPEQLLTKLKPFLFRFNLTLIPPPQDISEALAQLETDIVSVKTRWFSEDFATAIQNAGFRQKSKCLSRLEPMAEWCRGDSLDTDLWENWTSAYLQSVLTKAGSFPDHPLIPLIDSIVARQDLLSQLRFNLWHQVTATVKANIERYKTELSQLTLDDLLSRVREALAAPRTGEWLAASLGARWPVAMIDEFQDTDDIQYEIFSRIYRATAEHNLVFIGDPKQAIYQFRGADVFTYINAKRGIDSGSDVFSLSTNWRSTAPMVEAVNFLFDQPNIFDNDADIPFEPVQPAPAADQHRMTDNGREVIPVTLFQATCDSSRNKEQVRRLAMSFAAEEIARLLNGADAGKVCIDGAPLHAGQIAILVRDRRDARAAREALLAKHIRSVYVTLDSVFGSDTAEDLRIILRAVLEPSNEHAVRAALAVPLMQSTASEIAALSNNITAQQLVLQEFTEYHRLWAHLDVASMIERLIIRRRIAQKWFGKQDGERQITNLRHLTELLQERAATAPGMHRLVKWFTREKIDDENAASEERQLRLESDRNLVQIVTMHASKGLEYDIVMIPMAGFVPRDKASEPSLFHEITQGSFTTWLDFSDNPDHRAASVKEKFAEDMRLLYVAITRAKYKCYLGVPDTRDLGKSALARLLRLDAFDTGDVSAQLNSTFTSPLFAVTRAEMTEATPWEESRDTRHLAPPPITPLVTDNWRLHSYTGLSRLIQQSVSADTEESMTTFDVTPGFGDDEALADSQDSGDDSNGSRSFTPFSFPRGPRAGVALHTLLEYFDFTRSAEDQLPLITQCLDRIGLLENRADWSRTLENWLSDIVTTPLVDGVTLEQIEAGMRLDEMEFHFPLATGNSMLQLLQSNGYLDEAVRPNLTQLSGMMTGLIDLVFAHGGRFYIVDYKSNYLGNTATHYETPALQQAIKHHQYDLQYLIYCVALTRYLRNRVPDYRYETHFGGVFYLFLRGMQGVGTASASNTTGVFFDRPDEAFLARLDQIMGDAR